MKKLQLQKRSRRLTERFREALLYATELHANQTRKGSDEPYIGHLLGVASLVLQYGGNENEVIAALLHDAVEEGRTRDSQEDQKEIREKCSGYCRGLLRLV